MRISDIAFPPELRSQVEKNMVVASRLEATQFRLDAPAFLSSDKFASFIPNTSKSQPLAELADVFTVYIQSPILAYVAPFSGSRPYMTTSELAEHYQARSATHVSLLADARLLEWEIKRGNIIVSRSGRVGEAYWVDKKLDGALVGDSFRVVPKIPADGPFIYAVLSSKYARNFLSGSAYGSVVDHASVDQLRTFPMPELAAMPRGKIASTMNRAITAREHAYDLLDEAQSLLFAANDLLPLDTIYADADNVCFGVTCADITESPAGASEYRLEAHFHNPVARGVIATLLNSRSQKRTVGEVTESVFFCNRFSRTFVEEEHGIPYLAGKNIVQIRPQIEKCLSISETEELDAYKLHRGWTLITCSGTIGRTCFVWNNFEKWVATHDLIRVLANEREVDPAYLYAFLSCPYGFEQIQRFRHGSVIDHVTPEQIAKLIIPVPSPARQRDIGDRVRSAYEQRAEALRLEDEAHEILTSEIMGAKQ